MRIGKFSNFIFYCLLAVLINYSCTPKWTKSIHFGSIKSDSFSESIDVEVINGLIIIPVELRGKTYHFLFDTGAPNSISLEIQNDLNYKTVSKGHIIDTDRNRAKVKYIEIDSLILGKVAFYDQTAFVGDFTQNPLFKCLNIDGIVGSNLMRFCNWKIDYESKKILLTSELLDENDAYSKIPFTTDNQYNVLIDLNIAGINIKNITVDYGSNGSLSLPSKVFSELINNRVTGNPYREIGVSQAGIIGDIVEMNREIYYTDTLWLKKEFAVNVLLQSEGSGLLGSKVLSNWVVGIDWSNQLLYLMEKREVPTSGTHGFGIGYSNEIGIYVQSVIMDGPAYKIGLQPGMKILKINNTVFDKNEGFCAIANSVDRTQNTITISFEDFDGLEHTVTLEKIILK